MPVLLASPNTSASLGTGSHTATVFQQWDCLPSIVGGIFPPFLAVIVLLNFRLLQLNYFTNYYSLI